jgi:glycosyltransferase involved in cell wall biosynthesis
VGSEFVREAIARATVKPVHVVPLPVEPLAEPSVARADVGLPEDRFVFLFTFDFLSVFERKNPLALIEAFERAFSPGDGPVLVVKTINGEHDPEALLHLRLAGSGREDIHVVDGYVTATERDALVAHSDCYVSLHRSEG